MTPERIEELRCWIEQDREDYDVASNARSVIPECLDEVARLRKALESIAGDYCENCIKQDIACDALGIEAKIPKS